MILICIAIILALASKIFKLISNTKNAEKNSELMRLKDYEKSKWNGVMFPSSIDLAQYLK